MTVCVRVFKLTVEDKNCKYMWGILNSLLTCMKNPFIFYLYTFIYIVFALLTVGNLKEISMVKKYFFVS